MTLRECHVDCPFPYHVIRCWVRTPFPLKRHTWSLAPLWPLLVVASAALSPSALRLTSGVPPSGPGPGSISLWFWRCLPEDALLTRPPPGSLEWWRPHLLPGGPSVTWWGPSELPWGRDGLLPRLPVSSEPPPCPSGLTALEPWSAATGGVDHNGSLWGVSGVGRGRGGNAGVGEERGWALPVGPLVAACISFLTVDSLLFISLFQFLCPFLAISFPSVSFDLFPYRLLKSVFCGQAFSALTVLCAATTWFPWCSAMPSVRKLL